MPFPPGKRNSNGFDKRPEDARKSKGRPKTFGLAKTLREIIKAKGVMYIENILEVDSANKETGKAFKKGKVQIPKSEMIILAAVKKALSGDMRAINFIFDRIDGKAQQNISLRIEADDFNVDLLGIEIMKLTEYIFLVGSGKEKYDLKKVTMLAKKLIKDIGNV